MKKIVLLPPGPNNPRNSEGDFIRLRDGRLLFVYSHFTGGSSDHATAHLAGRISTDDGETWSEKDTLVLPNEGGMNVMSVSLMRLPDGRIALFYMRKNSLEDCRPLVRFSADETATWSEPRTIIPNTAMGYYVLNNDRVVVLTGGRLVVPVALHNVPGQGTPDWAGRITCYISDDTGLTWKRAATLQKAFSPQGVRVVAQEPGVLELRGGRLMMWVRTDAGVQYHSFSDDRGEHWSPLTPSAIASPLSPASIKRLPGSGDLLLVWNDHAGISPELSGRRTPLSVALSHDEGTTWEKSKTLEDDPEGWYCYIAVAVCGEHIVLGHCSGERRQALATTQITRFPIAWLYEF